MIVIMYPSNPGRSTRIVRPERRSSVIGSSASLLKMNRSSLTLSGTYFEVKQGTIDDIYLLHSNRHMFPVSRRFYGNHRQFLSVICTVCADFDTEFQI